MKSIFHYGKQIIIFTACAVVFAAAVFSALFREGTPSPDSFLSENAVCVDIFLSRTDVGEKVTYAELYSMFEARSELTVIKPFRSIYLAGIQIYSTDPDFFVSRYTDDKDIFGAHDNILLLDKDYSSFAVSKGAEDVVMLNSAEYKVDGYYMGRSAEDNAFVSNLYSFCGNNDFVDQETLFIDCGEATFSFAEELSWLFTRKNENYRVSIITDKPSEAAEMRAENVIIIVSVIFMIIIICFGSAVYVRIMTDKRMKEIFCKFLCGAELSVIRREFLREFAVIAVIGSAAGAVICLLLDLFASDLVTVTVPCTAAAAVIIPVLIFLICLYVRKSSFPTENDLHRRTRQ